MDVARAIAAPPSEAWALLTDTRMWPAWGPTVAAVEVEPHVIGPGSRGRLRPPFGPWLPFEVTSFDPGARWTWRVAGVPATGHRVEPTADGCRVVFEVPLPALAYVPVCRVALARIAGLLAERRPDGGAA